MNTDAHFNLDPESTSNADTQGVGLQYPPARLDPDRSPNGSARALARDDEATPPAIDPWSLAEAAARRWHWMAAGAIVFGALACLGALAVWKTSYTAKVQLIRQDSPLVVEVFRDRQTSMQTFADLLRAPDLLQRVSAAAQPPLSADALSSALGINPERNKESLTIAVTASSPERASELANLHAREAVQFTKQAQAQEANTLQQQLQQQLAAIDNQRREINERLRQSARTIVPIEQAAPAVDQQSIATPVLTRAETTEGGAESLSALKRSILAEQIRTAQVELGNLLSHFTEVSPLVKAQRIKLAVLEGQFEDLAVPAVSPVTTNKPLEMASVPAKAAPASTNDPAPMQAASRTIDLELGRSQLGSLDAARLPLAARQGLFQSLMDNPPGQLQVLVPARPQDVVRNSRKIKVVALTLFAALVGMVSAGLLVLLAEATGRRVKTGDDLRRVTRLPVIASLGDLRKMSQPARDQWSFQAWTALQGRLSAADQSGLVCGIISSSNGEGRSTLLQLLAQAATMRGHRVLAIDSCPDGETSGSVTNGHREEPDAAFESTTVTANVLASPGDVTHKLVGTNPKVIVHITLPDWSWNLERRKRLEIALDHWRAIDNVVILVNLPPASRPNAVLLAEELSNLVWLADSGRADAATTRRQMETLRHGRCHLIGAVLNHAPPRPLKNLFPRWVAA